MIAPYTLPGGERAWVDTEVADFSEHLSELDPRLALYREPDGGWLIVRIGEDGSTQYVMRSKPGARLGSHVIELLKQGDTRRHSGASIVDRIIKHNEKVDADRAAANEEATMIALDKVLSKSWRGHVPSNVEDITL